MIFRSWKCSGLIFHRTASKLPPFPWAGRLPHPDHHRVDSAHQGDELGSAEGDIVGIDAAGTGLGKFENRIGVEGSWVHITKHQTCSIEGRANAVPKGTIVSPHL